MKKKKLGFFLQREDRDETQERARERPLSPREGRERRERKSYDTRSIDSRDETFSEI